MGHTSIDNELNTFYKFKSKMQKYITDFTSQKFLLSVSGGVDSMALLLMFQMLKEEYNNIEIFVVTFNHFFRYESNQEVLFVKQYCENSATYCKIVELDILKGLIKGNKSSYAREARYSCLLEESKSLNCGYIVTAHHKDDQIETFLLRLERGSGIDGLSSIRESRKISDNVFLLRPLLEIKKQSLVNFMRSKKQINWVEDISNKKPISKRNVLRYILSQFSNRYSEGNLLENSIISSVLHMQSAQKALQHYTMLEFRNIVTVKLGYLVFNKEAFLSIPAEIQDRIIVLSLMVIGGHKYKPRYESFMRCRDLVYGDKNTAITLYGCKIKVSEKYFYILREESYIEDKFFDIHKAKQVLWDSRLFIKLEFMQNVENNSFENRIFLTRILREDLSKIKRFNSREKSNFLITMPVVRLKCVDENSVYSSKIVKLVDHGVIDFYINCDDCETNDVNDVEEGYSASSDGVVCVRIRAQFDFYTLIEKLL